MSFDSYESLLRNFSKHKFKRFVERLLLTPHNYGDEQLPDYANLFNEDWGNRDLAHMDMPTRMGVLFGITSYNRWIFHIDHSEDGLIKPDMIWEHARMRITELARTLSADKEYITNLQSQLYDRIGHFVTDGDAFHNPVYGSVQFHYLTNAELNPFAAKEQAEQLMDAGSNDIKEIFLTNAKIHGVDLDKASFGFGLGSPRIFLHQRRDLGVQIITELESRPDSLLLQFGEGRVYVSALNKRVFCVIGEKSPMPLLIDQVIDPKRFYLHDEISEFEALLNRKQVREDTDLQKFLEAHQNFLLHGDYDELRPQIGLVDEQGEELIPDFFLKPIDKHLWDILDIKLPSVPLLAGKRNREKLSQAVQSGISQLMNYAAFFDNPHNRDKVRKQTGIDCFKPRLTLVIGKKANIEETVWNKVIAQQRPFVNIIGFDEMLARARAACLKLPGMR